MANARFPVKKHAALELNRCAFLKNGLVVSQLPLSADFTEDSPCENGMIVNCNKAKGEVTLAKGDAPILGIVYTSEKAKDGVRAGLKEFYQVAGEYPRVGILHVGDTITTNCFCYDTATYTTIAALETALGKLSTNPLYLTGMGVMKLTSTRPTDAHCFEIIAYTTMPNGEKAVKAQFVPEVPAPAATTPGS